MCDGAVCLVFNCNITWTLFQHVNIKFGYRKRSLWKRAPFIDNWSTEEKLKGQREWNEGNQPRVHWFLVITKFDERVTRTFLVPWPGLREVESKVSVNPEKWSTSDTLESKRNPDGSVDSILAKGPIVRGQFRPN